ncbi:MAG: hypothetical protein KOO63_08160 [Bacteroidales bacterium]|nr:hypothetical protein [Candidatus Latescibacterota bacterium]
MQGDVSDESKEISGHIRSLESFLQKKTSTEGLAQMMHTLAADNQRLSARIDALSTVTDDITKSVNALPTQFPVAEKVDLSGLDKTIKTVGVAVKNIPTTKFPDMRADFSRIEKKVTDLQKELSKRVHVFDIERENDLVKRIVVRAK